MKSKLLVVDDSATILKIVAMAFEKENVAVEGIGNGKEAFEKMSDFRPDIVVADTDMPGINGFQLSKKIKESDQFKCTPVLLLTSDFEGFDEKLFKDCKADDHLAKPFKSEGIVNKVKQLLKEGSAEKPAAVKLSASDEVKKTATVKLSGDDVVDKPTPVKLSLDKKVDEVKEDEIDSLIGDDLDDILDDIIEETVLPDTTQGKSLEIEPVVEKPVTAKIKEAEKSETDQVSEKLSEEMSLDEMLESAEDSLLADDFKEPDQKDISSRAEEADEEPKSLSAKEKTEEQVSNKAFSSQVEESPLTAKPVKPEPAKATSAESALNKAGNVEKMELETESSEPVADNFQKEEKVKSPAMSNKPTEEKSIEDLLNSAEELLKDNYLEKVRSGTAEKETVSEKTAPTPNMNSGFAKMPEESKTVEVPKTPTKAKMDNQFGEESLADLDPSSLESEDELDSVFHTLQRSDKTSEKPGPEEGFEEREKALGKSHIHVEPESEDLLNQMASAAFTSDGIEGKPDLIQETLSYLSDLSTDPTRGEGSPTSQPQAEKRRKNSMNEGTTADMFSEVVGEHIQRILERSLQDAIAKEISGLSRTIERSVQEIVKEVTPGIARTIIQEEIEKIRKMEEV